jgi:hypothetical protein
MSFWDQFQSVGNPIKSDSPPQQPQENPVTQQAEPVNHDYWNQYKSIETQEAPETNLQSFGRQAKGVITKAMSHAAGLPGDIEQIGRSLIPNVSKENVLPTSEKFLEARKKLHPELEPKNTRERIQQEIGGEYILQPGGPIKKLFISAAGIFAKEAAKELGGGTGTQAGAQIISGILASRVGKPNVKDFINKEYEAASAAIPKDAVIDAGRASKYLSQVKEKVNEGGHAAWKDEVNKQINTLEKSIKGGKIKVTALDQGIKDINSHLLEKGIKGTQAEMWLTRIKQAGQHELKLYGKTNPLFLNHYKNANSAFAGFKQSIIAQRLVEKFQNKGLISGGLTLLTEALYHPEFAAQTGGALVAAYGAKKSVELVRRIWANPVLANYYMKATAAAAKENAPQFLANMNKLDKELKKNTKANIQ